MDVIKEIFNKCQRFEVRSWKVRFNFENPNPGSVGSRFDFLEVRRFEVRNFPVRPNTKQIIERENFLLLHIIFNMENSIGSNLKIPNLEPPNL